MSPSDFKGWLRERIEKRIPAAFVRFGDGEARLLAAEPDNQESMSDAIRKLRRETGLSFSAGDVLEVGSLVTLAYDEADVLGIRYSDNFVAEHKRWMEKLAVLYVDRVAEGRTPTALAHCLLNHQILDELPKMLSERNGLSVISCRDVRPFLENHWGLRDIAVYQVPSQHLRRDVDGAYEAAMHDIPIWPDVHARLREELTIREHGEVFLVGAGLFGKDLCIRIREQGGIALDMGSALDRMAGKITRGPKRRVLDLYARGRSVPAIAANLQNLGWKADEAMISGRLNAVIDDIASWRRGQLDAVYPITRFEAFQVPIMEKALVQVHLCYLASGVTCRGARALLGIWWRDAKDVDFWSSVLRDLHQRGVRNLLVTYVDCPQDFSMAAEAVFGHAPVHIALADQTPRGSQCQSPLSQKKPRPVLQPTYLRRALCIRNDMEAMYREVREVLETRDYFRNEQEATALVQLVATRTTNKLGDIRDWKPPTARP